MEQSTPSDRVKRAARGAGAIACRITSALPDEAARRSMREAFERGDLATWPYDGQYARAASSPDSLLPGAKSVICTAFAYATPPPSYAPLEGRVSNYAWSRDYHDRMHAALRAIAAVVDDLAGRPASAIACDTKPLAERAFAARAGLGGSASIRTSSPPEPEVSCFWARSSPRWTWIAIRR